SRTTRDEAAGVGSWCARCGGSRPRLARFRSRHPHALEARTIRGERRRKMRRARQSAVIVALTLTVAGRAGGAAEARAGETAVAWQGWSDAVFARAAREHRLVLLDLGAVWCHWCHVMEETTYKDPDVTALLRDHFVAVRVDQDARPDLSNRYE